jgi:hypothetical protein
VLLAIPLEGRLTLGWPDNLIPLAMVPMMEAASTVSNLATRASNALQSNHLQDLVPNANKRDTGRGIVPSLKKERNKAPQESSSLLIEAPLVGSSLLGLLNTDWWVSMLNQAPDFTMAKPLVIVYSR